MTTMHCFLRSSRTTFCFLLHSARSASSFASLDASMFRNSRRGGRREQRWKQKNRNIKFFKVEVEDFSDEVRVDLGQLHLSDNRGLAGRNTKFIDGQNGCFSCSGSSFQTLCYSVGSQSPTSSSVPPIQFGGAHLVEQPFLKSQKVIWKPKGYATIRGIETAEADEAIAKEAVDARVTDNNETSSENSNRLSALFVAKTAKAKHPLGVVSNVDNATYSEPKIGAYFCLKFENEKPNQEIRTRMMEMVSEGQATLEVSFIHSGSLFMFAGHDSGAYAKNCGDVYTSVGAIVLGRMFVEAWGRQASKKQKEFREFLEKNHMCISVGLVAAVMGDQRPLEDYAVVTAVTELGKGKPRFYSTPDLVAFCRKWRLPTNHVWLFSTRKSVTSFFAAYDASCEKGTATPVCRALDEVADMSVPGSKDHVKVQGKLVKGLVARILSHESTKHMQKVLCDYPPPTFDGVGLEMSLSLREICAANWTSEQQGCYREGKPDATESIFQEKRAKGYKLDADCYSKTILAICKIPNSQLACELLKEMKNFGLVPSGHAYGSVVGACVKQGNMSEALRVTEEMIADGFGFNPVVATCLIKGYYMKKDINAAMQMFNQMIDRGITPSVVSYSIMIEGCCGLGHMDKAAFLFEQMKGNHVSPNVFTFNAMMKGYLKKGMWRTALKLFDEAVDSDNANVFTYNILIYYLSKSVRMKEASELWKKMLSKGISPSIVSYNSLILGYCRQGDTEMASSVYSQMVEKGIVPNGVTYTTLMKGYFRRGDIDEALRLQRTMIRSGIAINDFTCNSIIDGLCKAGRILEANRMIEELKEKGFSPTSMAYDSIIDGHMKEGAVSSAVHVYQQMRDGGVPPSIVTHTIFIDSFCKAGRVDLALKLFNKVEKQGLELDIVAYNSLIDGYSKIGQMNNARLVLNKLIAAGLTPTCAVYNSLIHGYVSQDNIEEALELFRKMRKDGIAGDVSFYTTLIHGSLKSGNTISASRLYVELLDEGLIPDAITFSVLVNGFCRKGQIENAHKLLPEMERKGLLPNVPIYNSLIDAYFKKGNLREAFRLHNEMLDKGLMPDDRTYDILVNSKLEQNVLLWRNAVPII